MHTTIVKLNPLADTVGTTTDNHRFGAIGDFGFVATRLPTIRTIKIGSGRREFSRTGVNFAVHRHDFGLFAGRPYLHYCRFI